LLIDLLSSRVNDLLKLSAHYRMGRLFWPILSTIGLSDFHTIVLTPIVAIVFVFINVAYAEANDIKDVNTAITW